MKKIFILLVVLFIIPSCSWIASAIDESIQKKEEEKQREIAQKNIDELRKKQALEKENRLNELITLYDKGLTKDISEDDMKDFNLYIEDIRKIDSKKAANIDIFMCNTLGHFDACFRTVEYYAKNKNKKKAEEVFEKLYSTCVFDGYSKACGHVNKVLTISIKNNGQYTLYDGMFLKSYLVFDKNSGSVKLEFIDVTNKVSMPFVIENGWNPYSVTCFTGFESALKAKDKIEEYYTDKCELYPSLDGQGVFYNQGFDYKGAIKANKDYVYIEVPDYFINTDFGGISYKGYTIKIPKKVAKEIYQNLSSILLKNIKIEKTDYFNVKNN